MNNPQFQIDAQDRVVTPGFVDMMGQSSLVLVTDPASAESKLRQTEANLARLEDIVRVLETHGHWDHIGAVTEIRNAGYEVGVTALDAPMLDDVGYAQHPATEHV